MDLEDRHPRRVTLRVNAVPTPGTVYQVSYLGEMILYVATFLTRMISELSYIVKHVEEHGRESSDDPWSIRQMGVYHQQDSSLDRNTFIILNPSKTFQRRLRDTQTISGKLPSWEDIHKLLASCSTVAWKRYISYHESHISKLVSSPCLNFNVLSIYAETLFHSRKRRHIYQQSLIFEV